MPIVNQNAQSEGIALAHTLAGEHVGGSGGVTHAEGDVQPAGLHSMAPYVSDEQRALKRKRREAAVKREAEKRKVRGIAPEKMCTVTKADGSRCQAVRIEGTERCYFHTQGKQAADESD